MAKFGGKQPGAGRPPGKPNRSTLEFKEAVNNLISFATPQMIDWLEKIAAEDPAKALDMVYKFAQFGYPLLQRSEQQLLDKNGKPTDPVSDASDRAVLARFGFLLTAEGKQNDES